MTLENCFSVQGRSYLLKLDEGGLTWHLAGSLDAVYHVPACQILSCWCCPKGALGCAPSFAEVFNETANLRTKSHQNHGFTCNPPHLLSNGVSSSDVDIEVGVYSYSNRACSASSPMIPKSSQIGPVPDPKISSAFDESADDNPNASPALRCNDLIPPSCKHSKKNNPALAVEVCERVLPSSRWCSSGHYSNTVIDWTTRVIVFSHDYKDTVITWFRALWSILRGIRARPRRLVAIINPLGGKKTCAAIYEHQVAPLLRRAAIAVTVSTTTHSGHAESIAEEAAGTPGVDGVLVVGGDGVVAEAANGLLKYEAKFQGAKLDDRTASLPRNSIRLGAIPGGSTNAFFMSLQGTDSPVTAVLQVIMGFNLNVDVGGVYADDRLLHFTVCGIHVGFLGALLETSVKLRSLGPIRDVIGATREIFRNRSYTCSLRFLEQEEKPSSPYDDTVCCADCRVCSSPETDDAATVWTERNGDYHLIMIPLQSLECRYCKYGVSPACHTGDGTADLLLVPKSSMPSIVSEKLTLVHFRDHLKRTSVEAFRSCEIHCQMDPSVPINLDGELRYYPSFVVRVHRQRLAIFCRGREPLSSLDLSKASNNF